MLPEYLVENISEYLDFLFRYKPDVLENQDKDVLINFFIVFLTPGYINNPFLKAKFVSVSNFSTSDRDRPGVLIADLSEWTVPCWLLPKRLAFRSIERQLNLD